MNRQKWLKTICFVLAIAAVSFAQAPATQSTGAEEKATAVEADDIFNDIMQSLPGQLRAEVDSANRAGAPAPAAPDAEAVQQRSENREQLREQQLSELPEQTRQQVEKAIGRMDENLQQRQLQFKEQKGEMNGGK